MGVRLVGLIRGINVGKAKRVAMADLRAAVEGLGYRDPKTLLNTGNLVFTDPDGDGPGDAAGRIEAAMADRLGVQARVVVITAAELDAIVRSNPLLDRAGDHSRLLVAVLADPADRRRLEPLLAGDWSPEAIALGDRAAYLWCPDGVLASRLPEAVGRSLGDAVTTRNAATMAKLAALAGAGS